MTPTEPDDEQVNEEEPPNVESTDMTERSDGRSVHSADSLTGMLGWNSIGVFDAEANFDGETLHVNNGAVFVVLTDPWPEYKQFIFLDGEFHHANDLLSMEFEGVFEDHFEDYGEATVFPLDSVDFIARDEHGIPQMTA